MDKRIGRRPDERREITRAAPATNHNHGQDGV